VLNANKDIWKNTGVQTALDPTDFYCMDKKTKTRKKWIHEGKQTTEFKFV